MSEQPWKYGFYDSEDSNQTIYWYAFGILEHDTAESAARSGSKSTWGRPVIVRRRENSTEWEHTPIPAPPTGKEAYDHD